jgi:hypothetical protein
MQWPEKNNAKEQKRKNKKQKIDTNGPIKSESVYDDDYEGRGIE